MPFIMKCKSFRIVNMKSLTIKMFEALYDLLEQTNG